MNPRVLVVVSVPAERDALLAAGCPARHLVVGGVGPVAAAAAAAAACCAEPYAAVISAGIAGGFAPVAVGDVVVGTHAVYADFGAETADGFLPMSGLGLGTDHYPADPALAAVLAERAGAATGPILTVTTVTGTAERAGQRAARHPGVVAEAMEGAGIAAAALQAGVPFAEIRAISNLVGPRDRASWRIADALQALGTAVAKALDGPLPVSGPRPTESWRIDLV